MATATNVQLQAERREDLQQGVKPDGWLGVLDAVYRAHGHVCDERQPLLVHALPAAFLADRTRDVIHR